MTATKIIATVGPASDEPKMIKRLVKAGVNVFRFNFKHNTLRWHDDRIAMTRKAAKRKATILIDICGPEGRVKSKTTLFEDDLAALGLAKKYQVEWVALSFTRDNKDVKNLKKAIKGIGLEAKIIAKIENQSGIDHFQAILKEAEAIMVARGDLGEELAIEQVPYWQKKIIKACRRARKPVIVATEMLESMVSKPRPTRAEISDVAQAVYDRADFVMLSAETAIGKYPVETVKTMRQTISFITKKIAA